MTDNSLLVDISARELEKILTLAWERAVQQNPHRMAALLLPSKLDGTHELIHLAKAEGLPEATVIELVAKHLLTL